MATTSPKSAASSIEYLIQKSDIITKKRTECSQQKIFFLTGLNQTVIDEIIGKISTGERIGKGGFSTVYKVNHGGQNYAIKYEKYDEDITKDVFAIELSIALYLTANDRTRPYVPFTFGGRIDDQGGYIVMEVLDGKDLRYVLEHRHISEKEREFLGKKLEDAIRALHSVKVMHLDLGNLLNIFILFDYNNITELVLIDFNASNYTNYSRPYNIRYDYNNSESFVANLQYKHFNKNKFPEINISDSSNIKVIHTTPRTPRTYEMLLTLSPEQFAEINVCEKELEQLEIDYYQLQKNTYSEREVNWIRNINEHDKKPRYKKFLRTWLTAEINEITGNDEHFLELFGEDLFNFLYSIFKKYRQQTTYFRTSYNRALIPTKEIAQQLYNRYREHSLPLKKGEEEALKRDGEELFESRRHNFERDLVENGDKGFKGGKTRKIKNTIRRIRRAKTQKKSGKSSKTI